MDEYQTRQDLRQFYRSKRRAENNKVSRTVWFAIDVLLMAGVLYIIATNPYKP